MARAKLAQLQDDEAAALEAWEKAFELARESGNSDALVAVYRSGVAINQPDAAIRALLEAAKSPPQVFPPANELQLVFNYLHEKDRLEDLLLMTQAAMERDQGNLLLRNNSLYLSLVLGKTPEGFVEEARKLMEAQPHIPALRSTLALALLRDEKHAEALRVLEGIKSEQGNDNPSYRAILAVALEKNGKMEEAMKIWDGIEKTHLASAERKAFRDLLGRGG